MNEVLTTFASIAILAEAAANPIQLGTLTREGFTGYHYAALSTNDMLNLPDDLSFEEARPEHMIEVAERLTTTSDPGMKMLALAWLARHAPERFGDALSYATS